MAQIEFDLKLAVDDFQKSIDKANDSIDSFHNSFKENVSTSSIAFGNFIGGLALDAVKAFGSGIVNTFGDMISEAIQAEEEINNLNIALSQTGINVGTTSQELQDLANSLEATTTYSGGAVMSATALIQTMASLEKDGLKAATNAAVELSAAMGIDLNQAATLVAKAANGNTAALGKMGIEIKKGTTDAETFANTLDALAKFEGTAEAKTKTFAGALAQTKNAYDATLESLGLIVTQNPIVIAGINALTEALKGSGAAFESVSSFIAEYSDYLEALGIGIGVVVTAWGAYAAAQGIATAAMWAFNAAMNANPLVLVGTAIAAVIASLVLLYKKWDEVTIFFQEGVVKILEFMAPIEGILARVFGFDEGLISSKIDSIKNKIKETQDEINSRNPATIDVAGPGDTSGGSADKDAEQAKIRAEQEAARNEEALAKRSEHNAKIEAMQAQHNANLTAMDQEKAIADSELQIANFEAESAILAEQGLVRTEQELAEQQARKDALAEQKLVHEEEKIEAQYEFDAAQAQLLTDKYAQEEALLAAKNKKELALIQAQNKAKADADKQAAEQNKKTQQAYATVDAKMTAMKEQNTDAAVGFAKTGAQAIAKITGASAKQQFLMQKAFAIADVVLQDGRARAQAVGLAAQTAAMAGPAAPAVFAAALAGFNAQISISTGLALATIAAATIGELSAGSFAKGGIVGGNSFRGDRLTANVNSGEMILNSAQQRELFQMANGGGAQSGLIDTLVEQVSQLQELVDRPIIVQVGDDEIARATARGVQNGVDLYRSR